MPDRSCRRRAGYAAGAMCAVALLLTACGPRPVGEGGLGQDGSASPSITSTVAATAVSTPSTTALTARSTVSSSSSRMSSAASASSTTAAPAGAASSGPAKGSANTPAAAASTPTASVTLYFTKGGTLVSEPRTVPAADPLRSSLEELLAGPKVAGDYSEVPRGTRLLGVSITGNTANVNLSSQVQSLQGAPAIPLFLGQVVNTATQFQGVERVSLQVEGRPVRTLGGEGVAVPEPLDKAAVQRLLAESGG